MVFSLFVSSTSLILLATSTIPLNVWVPAWAFHVKETLAVEPASIAVKDLYVNGLVEPSR